MSIVSDWLSSNDIDTNAEKLELLTMFKNTVLEKNKVMNLTAITDSKDFDIKHIIDSLTLLPLIPPGSEVIDVGTGAGFPGIVLKIMRDDIKLTLMDSRKKRIDFLEEAVHKLNLTDVKLINARSEEWAKKNPVRFDICTARAVAELSKLVTYTLPLLKEGGSLLAMKGPDIQNELQKAKPAIKKHGGSIIDIKTIEISKGLKHSIIVIRNEKQKADTGNRTREPLPYQGSALPTELYQHITKESLAYVTKLCQGLP